MQQDSYRGEVGEALSHNLTTYCNNNPLKYVDPSGHAAFDVFYSMDRAAKDFGKIYNPYTHLNNIEYGAMIFKMKYRVKGKNSWKITYAWSGAHRGSHDTVWRTFLRDTPDITKQMKSNNKGYEFKDIQRCGFAHTHPCCTCHQGEVFSPADRATVSLPNLYACYLATPEGKLYKYTKENGTSGPLYTDLPKAIKKYVGQGTKTWISV